MQVQDRRFYAGNTNRTAYHHFTGNRGRPKAQCYPSPFNLAGHCFRAKNRQVHVFYVIWYEYDIIDDIMYDIQQDSVVLLVPYPNNLNTVESFNVTTDFELAGDGLVWYACPQLCFHCTLCPTGSKGPVYSATHPLCTSARLSLLIWLRVQTASRSRLECPCSMTRQQPAPALPLHLPYSESARAHPHSASVFQNSIHALKHHSFQEMVFPAKQDQLSCARILLSRPACCAAEGGGGAQWREWSTNNGIILILYFIS